MSPSPLVVRRYGGFWIRLVALLVDSLILGAAYVVCGVVLGLAFAGGSSDSGSGEAPGALVALIYLVGIVGTWLYFALQESSAAQATLGKRACGLKVVDDAGRRLSFGRASGRHFAKILSGLILYIGYLMAAFDPRKRALHDMVASTLVVQDMAGFHGPPPGPQDADAVSATIAWHQAAAAPPPPPFSE